MTKKIATVAAVLIGAAALIAGISLGALALAAGAGPEHHELPLALQDYDTVEGTLDELRSDLGDDFPQWTGKTLQGCADSPYSSWKQCSSDVEQLVNILGTFYETYPELGSSYEYSQFEKFVRQYRSQLCAFPARYEPLCRNLLRELADTAPPALTLAINK